MNRYRVSFSGMADAVRFIEVAANSPVEAELKAMEKTFADLIGVLLADDSNFDFGEATVEEVV